MRIHLLCLVALGWIYVLEKMDL